MQKNPLTIIVPTIALLVITSLTACVDKPPDPSWDAIRDKVMLQLIPVSNKEKIDAIRRPFSDEVDIGYVIDGETKYAFINEDKLKEWNISEEDLHEEATANLEETSEDIEIEFTTMEGYAYGILEVLDGYAAARILLPSIRERMAVELDEPYVAGIPTRDFLIAWPKDFPIHQHFAEQVRKEFETEESYPLSPNLFVVTKEAITPVAQQ